METGLTFAEVMDRVAQGFEGLGALILVIGFLWIDAYNGDRKHSTCGMRRQIDCELAPRAAGSQRAGLVRAAARWRLRGN